MTNEHELGAVLKTLRDELRVHVHLASMDAREAFARIEREAEHLVAAPSRKALGALVERLERLRDSIQLQ